MEDRWTTPRPKADPLDRIVHLSNLVGLEQTLVQPGGGNTSIKLERAANGATEQLLLVKGSGTDLRTIDRRGFTWLPMSHLGGLRRAGQMSDEDMMQFMAAGMINASDPVPSVETPLHSVLPYNVIVHTHDVATMSLTNLRDSVAERLVTEVFEGEIQYVPYARPGFPLAKLVSERADDLPVETRGLTLAHHGLVVWGPDPAGCYANLLATVSKIDAYLQTRRRGQKRIRTPGIQTSSLAEARRSCAETLMPVVRGQLGREQKVILHFDDSDPVLEAMDDPQFRESSMRGMTTPEHILRAGRLPVWLDVDVRSPAQTTVAQARLQLNQAQEEYTHYHERHAPQGTNPLADWAKVVLVPGVGMITAFKDKQGARTANVCYRAGILSIRNADAIDGFTFVPEAEVFEFEHWPLERRKLEAGAAQEHQARLLPRHVVVVVGAGSGIGKAAAQRFAEEGAYVVAADVDAGAATETAAELSDRFPQRVVGLPADVTDEPSISELYRAAVLEFGGLDCLFYTAGLAPRFAPLTELTRADLQRQLDVHYLGAVSAIQRAAEVMIRQGTGGSVVASVSKAALAPGKEALAYGASKAALLHALRVAAVELGPHGVRVNAINADQVATPMFEQFVAARAEARGVSVDEQLEAYRDRNLMGVSMIPANSVAELAVLLASDRFQYTTGDIITVDGGLPEAFPR